MGKNIGRIISTCTTKLEFLGQGEKLRKIRHAIEGIKNKLRTGKNKFPEEFQKLCNLSKEDLRTALYALNAGYEHEFSKFEELHEVFNKFNSRITKEKLGAIPYPDRLRYDRDDDYGIRKMTIFYFTSGEVTLWFQKNIDGVLLKRYPFRVQGVHGEDKKILERRAFGIAKWEKVGEKEYQVMFIQPLVFFYKFLGLPFGKGLRQPLPKAHLLMLFLLLKEADYRKADVVKIQISEMHGTTQREIYREIIEIAAEYTDDHWAIFKKS